MSWCLEYIWNYFSVIVQWLTFPTSYYVTRLAHLSRSYSAPREIVRFWESFIFVPTCSTFRRFVRGYNWWIQIEKFSEASRRAPRRMREIGKQLFEDIRRQAESIINPKINDELDLKLKYKFDWQMNECLGTSRFVYPRVFILKRTKN